MSARRPLPRPAWFTGEVDGIRVEVDTTSDTPGRLIRWRTRVFLPDGTDEALHDTPWEAHGHVDETIQNHRAAMMAEAR